MRIWLVLCKLGTEQSRTEQYMEVIARAHAYTQAAPAWAEAAYWVELPDQRPILAAAMRHIGAVRGAEVVEMAVD